MVFLNEFDFSRLYGLIFKTFLLSYRLSWQLKPINSSQFLFFEDFTRLNLSFSPPKSFKKIKSPQCWGDYLIFSWGIFSIQKQTLKFAILLNDAWFIIICSVWLIVLDIREDTIITKVDVESHIYQATSPFILLNFFDPPPPSSVDHFKLQQILIPLLWKNH